MKKQILLIAVLSAFSYAMAEEMSPVVETAPGVESLYKADVAAQRYIDDQVTQLDEILYRINFDGDNAYIYNLFSVSNPEDFYVTADVVDNDIYIPTGFVYKDMGYAAAIVRRIVKDSEGEWMIGKSDDPIIWHIQEDGTIKDEDPDVKMGLVFYFYDEEEPGKLDENDPGLELCIFDDICLSPADLTGLELPSGVTESMDFRCYVNYEMDETYMNNMIHVARDGNDFYFKGLYDDVSGSTMQINCWVKGSLEGGVITIPSGQLVGIDARSYFCYNSRTYIDWEIGMFVIDENPVKFLYDENTQTMTTEDWLLITQGRNQPFLYFPSPELTKFDLVEATPAEPKFVMYDDEWFDFAGTTDFVFLIPYEDVNGNFIDPNRITYSLFMDSDDPYVFEPEEYPDFAQPVSEFGFYESTKYTINTQSEGYQRHIVYFTTNSYEKIGVQSYYTVNGKRNASSILWYDRTGSVVDKINDDKEIVDIQTYDLMGHKVCNSSNGMVIKKITYADGTTSTIKEISK